MGYKLAIIGATGNVGRALLEILSGHGLPIDEVFAIASRRSLGLEVSFGDATLKCKDLEQFDFSRVDIALMSAGGELSKEWAPKINVIRYLAATYYRLKRYSEAAAELLVGLQQWPEEIPLLEQLGRVLEMAGEYEGAAQVWQQVLEIDLNHPKATSRRDRLLEWAHDPSVAAPRHLFHPRAPHFPEAS